MKKSTHLLSIVMLLSLTMLAAACKGHGSSSEKDSSSTSLGTRNGGGASGVADSTSSNMSTDTSGRDTSKKDNGIVP